jgi:glycosyltransferase involved in cell wall biosynthesis
VLSGADPSALEVADRPFVPYFVLEQTLGHVTHGKNLQALVPSIAGTTPVFLPIDASLDGRWSGMPGWSNWTIRAGVRARRAIRHAMRDRAGLRADALFVHSQVPSILLVGWMRRLPSIVSLDATPLQYDHLGAVYAHEVGTGPAERLKKWANVRAFTAAEHIVAWSDWAKSGLVAEYGDPADKITVIAPGVDVARWARPLDMARPDGPLRVLFVGGDLERKGGDQLIAVARQLRAAGDVPAFDLHLVTTAAVETEDGVVVHRGLTPNSDELVEQYHLADIFCLPTLGDCLPMVLAEAGAAGLPLISTDVGAISGLVEDGVTGRLIAPASIEQLTEALRQLLVDEDARRRFGEAARSVVVAEHDARRNAQQLVELLASISSA